MWELLLPLWDPKADLQITESSGKSASRSGGTEARMVQGQLNPLGTGVFLLLSLTLLGPTCFRPVNWADVLQGPRPWQASHSSLLDLESAHRSEELVSGTRPEGFK